MFLNTTIYTLSSLLVNWFLCFFVVFNLYKYNFKIIFPTPIIFALIVSLTTSQWVDSHRCLLGNQQSNKGKLLEVDLEGVKTLFDFVGCNTLISYIVCSHFMNEC